MCKHHTILQEGLGDLDFVLQRGSWNISWRYRGASTLEENILKYFRGQRIPLYGWIKGNFPPFIYCFPIINACFLQKIYMTLKIKTKTQKLQQSKTLLYLGLPHPPGYRVIFLSEDGYFNLSCRDQSNVFQKETYTRSQEGQATSWVNEGERAQRQESTPGPDLQRGEHSHCPPLQTPIRN